MILIQCTRESLVPAQRAAKLPRLLYRSMPLKQLPYNIQERHCILNGVQDGELMN